MLNHLTNYLLQYKTVCVPHVGTLRLAEKPPSLNVVDKRIEPAAYTVEIDKEENVPLHQVDFLDGFVNNGKEVVERELRSFGNTVRQKMAEGGFDWEGLGLFTNETKSIPVHTAALAALPAQKVIRHDVAHNVLVGDREISSAQVFERTTDFKTPRGKRKVFIRAGWILLLLSVLLLLLVLYAGKFRTNAAGSRLSPTNWIMPNP